MPVEERLQKYLAAAGVASRRACETMITQGRVAVNSRVVTQLGTKIDPTVDVVTVDGEPVRPAEEMVYLMLNKPAGYLTTADDPQGRPTVLDLLQDVPQRVFPVGRLDYETEGLLLLTNDGDFAYRMTHPKFEMVKTYQAWVQGQPSREKLDKLRQGVKLEDGMTKPADIKILRQEKYKMLIEVKISEGKKRQVRRMFKAIDNPVLTLKRVQVDSLVLSKLPVGEYRPLTLEELMPLMHKLQLGERLEKMMK